MVDPQQALEMAKRMVGGTGQLASKVGITPQAVSQWKRVPADRVLIVEAATDGRVSRHELRPDIYPTPEQVAA